MVKEEIKLKVVEALQDDAYKGIARIDSGYMKRLGVSRGDVISIKGGRETFAIVDRAYPADIGENIIRVDGIIRKNAKTGIGEMISVNKADVKEANKVIIAPAQKGIMVQADADGLRRGLLGRIIIKGDIVVLGGVQRRRDIMSEEMGDLNDIFGNLNDLFGGNLGGFGGGITQIKFVVVSTNPSLPVVITENTEVVLNPKAVEVSEDKVPDVTYEDIGGLSEEIKKIREMVELPLKHPEIFEKLGIEPPRGVLLHGTPGTGKTMLAKAVANESDANFILINGPELMSKFYGESEKNLREKFEEAEKSAPSIIFIDEIDAIASKREEAVGEVERRVVSQMLTLMDGLQSRGKVIVIGATNRPNALDPALRRPGRFDREITINVPDKKGRLSILKIHTRDMPLTKDVNLEEFAEVTHGFVGADISSLAKEAAMNVLRRVLPQIKMDEDKEISKEVLESLQVTKKDFQEALKIVRPSAMREVLVETPNVKWSDVGGLDIAKQELKEAIEWPMRNPAVFERMGIKPPRGILTYGPPGTGKTLLAKAIANESGANFILVKGPELLSMWVGKSEEGVRKIFERARQVAPCIIFFDEIDSLAARRGADMGSRVGDQVLNQILAEIDGLEELRGVVVVGATNRPDMLDPALLRPGRFDRLLLVTPPDKKGRLEIFKIHTRNMPVMEEKLSKELDIVLKGLSLRLLEKELSELSLDLKKNRKEFDILVEYKNVISSFIKVPNNGIQEEKEEKITKKEDKNYDFRKLIGLLMDIDKEKQKTIGELADKAEGYVGADIEGVCREAALLTLRDDLEAKEVKKKYFEKAMNKVKASVSKESMDKYRRMEDEYLKSAKSALEKEVRYLG